MVSAGIFSMFLPIFAAYFLVKCRASIGMSSGRSRKRRRGDRKHFQPVVEIAAEQLVAHHLGKIAVGRGHQPDVDRDRLRAAQPLERLVLQGAEQLGLKVQRNVADFVQKQECRGGPFRSGRSFARAPR